MIRIDTPLLDTLSGKAKAAPRRRTNHNFHQSAADPLNRMLNAMEPGTYVQPHKHENPDKREAFLLLRGKMLVVSFDAAGRVTDHVVLDPQTGNFGLEVPPRTYHTLICLAEGSVLYELKDGPYDVTNDKTFAPWAPPEGSAEAPEYNRQLLRQLGLS
ncbi:MAG: WbuC family cupin fold metalloprotein [Cytophagales bacterium]|nr:WbuC family cupin fold metalloprotein [Cytophagales bacterium]